MGKIQDVWNKVFHSKKINFLGLKSAGKTQILTSLGAKGLTPGAQSHGENYESFSIQCFPDDNKKFIKCGVDYGGGLSKFISSFTELIKKGDYVFFTIDINEFIKNIERDSDETLYQEAVFSRLDIINETVTNKQKDKVYIILTHADLQPSFTEDELINQFAVYTQNKPYHVLTKNCYALNATDSKRVKEVFYKILSL